LGEEDAYEVLQNIAGLGSEQQRCSTLIGHGETQRRRSTGLARRRTTPQRRSSGFQTSGLTTLAVARGCRNCRCRLT